MEAIVVDTESTARQCIQYLKDQVIIYKITNSFYMYSIAKLSFSYKKSLPLNQDRSCRLASPNLKVK
jgi:chromosome segregation ATPase